MECLNIKEADLVRSLIKWGNFQLQQHVDGDNLGESLRSKILPGLRKIRFDGLTQQEIAQLYQEGLEVVLSADEKCSILMAIITGDWKLMPNDVVSSSKLCPRHEPYTFCCLPFVEDPSKKSKRHGLVEHDFLTFQIDKAAAIVGVKLNLKLQFHANMTFQLYNRSVKLADGKVSNTSLHKGEVFCKFNTKQTLAAGVKYDVYFEFDSRQIGFRYHYFNAYTLSPEKNPSSSDGLTLTVESSKLTLATEVKGIVFQMHK